jgi:lysophospholipase L1-like esterase
VRPAVRSTVAGVAVLVLVACSGGGSRVREALPGVEGSPPETPTTRGPLRYISLGDSYPAGEGLPRPVQPCGRTPGAYPQLVADEIPTIAALHACNGATTADVLERAQFTGVPPQIETVTADADVVTISIGGNDIGFARTIRDCVLNQLPCTRLEGEVNAALVALGPRLGRIYGEIRRRAPGARLLVVGYPQLVVDPERSNLTSCAGLTVDESYWVRTKGDELAAVIRTAAEVAGARYVDAAERFAGHEACTPEPWMEGVNFTDIVASFHPNATGHVELAKMVKAALPGR